MKIRFARSTKLMSLGIVLSLGWFLFESCQCDETREENFPGFWVACVNNQPTLMTYTGNSPTIISTDEADQTLFDPSQYDCTHPDSPHYKGSETDLPFPVGTPSGPGGSVVNPRATSALTAYLPQPLRDLPFLPHVALPTANSVCSSSFPDVLQTNHNTGGLTRITTCPFQIKTVIPLGTNTLQVAVTPDGATAVVTSFDSAVYLVDLSTNTLKQSVLLDGSLNPDGVAISPDGTRAYITSFNNNTPTPVIVVLDLTSPSKATIATIPTIQFPSGATLTPDGSQLWITSPLSFDMAVIDTLTNTNIINLGINMSTDVAFNSTGTRAYITSDATRPGQVYVVDTGTFQTVQTYTVGNNPSDIKMSYGDQWLVVNNDDDGTISVIDLQKNAVVTSAQLGANPSGISFVH